MLEKNQNLFLQIGAFELQKIIAKTISEEINRLIETIQVIPSENDEKNVITRIETAELLKVSLPTLNLWDKKKILVAQKIGNRVYYLKNDIMDKLNRAS